MKHVFMLLTLCLVVVLSYGQEAEKELTRKEKRAMAREEKKKEQELIDNQLRLITKVAVDSAQWVLEADRLSGRKGGTINVSSTLNFIAIEGDKAFVQLGSNSGLGANGVGGVSVRGNVTKYEVEFNEKRGTYYIVVMVSSSLGVFDIRMNSNSTGQMVDATVKGNSRHSVRYTGALVPVAQSRVYKGTPIL
ncbi:DUF4251 domain-containing protein [Labilibacter marinus]|uniref:DUF4251 domain-containing protein n=1 Tax=Labilibacter marinus TaxID=1477105 RepID=UPI0009500F7B|nr:DUF4251 domain-containing protein [Labilibacter marinus]